MIGADGQRPQLYKNIKSCLQLTVRNREREKLRSERKTGALTDEKGKVRSDGDEET